MTKNTTYGSVQQVKQFFPLLYGEISDFQVERYEKLLNRFNKEFGYSKGYIASSSGRVEICGNHTDHNGGRVLACAISLDTLAVFMPTDDNKIVIKSEGYPEFEVDLQKENFTKSQTSKSLVEGICVALKNNGYKVGGFCASITSNVLSGAGISSSASFELLIVEIFNFLYNDSLISEQEKAKFAQFAENVYFEKPCGLLDQTAIAFGGVNQLDFFNNNRIKVNKIQNQLSDYSLVLINTGGSHENLTNEYASIPNEMFSIANYFGYKRLIDIDEKEFRLCKNTLIESFGERAVLRAEHFFEENKRVDKAVKALNENDYDTFLNMVNLSGKSSLLKLQNCFVPNCDVKPIPKALELSEKFLFGGANRVHGGGFAGCILCLVSNENKDKFVSEMKKFYNDLDIILLKVRNVGTLVL